MHLYGLNYGKPGPILVFFKDFCHIISIILPNVGTY